MTVEIVLTRGAVALIDDEDAASVSAFSWCLIDNGRQRYAMARYCGKHFQLANWIMRPPPQLVVDHINGDGLDNRRCNLRICTQNENLQNRRRRIDCIYPVGVDQGSDGAYSARITVDKQRHDLGKFLTTEEASAAYQAASVRLRGEFARTNYDDPLGLSRATLSSDRAP